jgi:hypothetical protein
MHRDLFQQKHHSAFARCHFHQSMNFGFKSGRRTSLSAHSIPFRSTPPAATNADADFAALCVLFLADWPASIFLVGRFIIAHQG